MAVEVLLQMPRAVFTDAAGVPLAGGLVHSYIQGSTTPKQTFQDAAGVIPNQNPIVLDSSGSCLLYGDGTFTLAVTDSAGNEVPGFSGDTQTIAALLAVEVARATAAEAVLQAEITAETARATAAEATNAAAIATETAARIAAVSAEQAARIAADAALQAQISTSGLPAGYSIQFGFATTSSGGTVSVSFSPAYATALASLVGTADVSSGWWVNFTSTSRTGFTASTSSPLHGGNWIGGPIGFNWIAIGH